MNRIRGRASVDEKRAGRETASQPLSYAVCCDLRLARSDPSWASAMWQMAFGRCSGSKWSARAVAPSTRRTLLGGDVVVRSIFHRDLAERDDARLVPGNCGGDAAPAEAVSACLALEAPPPGAHRVTALLAGCVALPVHPDGRHQGPQHAAQRGDEARIRAQFDEYFSRVLILGVAEGASRLIGLLDPRDQLPQYSIGPRLLKNISCRQW